MILKKPTPKQNRKRKIIWSNPPFSKNVSTNIGKKFLNLINKHFPPQNKLHKIFNRNTLKLSYSCTKNMGRIIKSHNKKITATNTSEKLDCNCRQKQNCPLNGKCREKNVIYKCVASVPNKPDKVYIGLTEGEWKKKDTQGTKHLLNTKSLQKAQLFQLISGKLKKKKKSTQF